MRRNNPDPREMQREQAQERSYQQAEGTALNRGAQSQAPMDPLEDMTGGELFDKLTQVGVESDEFGDLEELLQPYMSTSGMLASHDEDYYDDRSHRLLNENLADRLIKGRRYGRLCTGPFRKVAQEVSGDKFDGVRSDFSQAEIEAMRTVLADVRTDRQSLGDGTFLDATTQIHVSTETHRKDDADGSSGKGGLLSMFRS